MKSVGAAPKLIDFKMEHPVVNDWMLTVTSRLKLYSGAADPTAAEVPKSQWIVYKNTTLNEVRVWVNDNGTMKKSAAFV